MKRNIEQLSDKDIENYSLRYIMANFYNSDDEDMQNLFIAKNHMCYKNGATRARRMLQVMLRSQLVIMKSYDLTKHSDYIEVVLEPGLRGLWIKSCFDNMTNPDIIRNIFINSRNIEPVTLNF